LIAPQLSDQILLNRALGVDVDEVVDGFVAHASGWIMRVASAQGDFDLLGSGSGLQQGQQVAMQGGRISDFVAFGALGPTMSAVTSKPASCGHFKTSHSEGGLVIGLVGG
jgi:hypothetical protein